ncbi:MAG: response regulator [Candidatus Sericytochromatia bacterium]|nr:response regulator [Candidatus Sericytochromatia bacterium]
MARKATVLWIDEDVSLLEQALPLLRQAGFDVMTFTDEAMAWKCLRAQHIDILVCELSLKGLSGLELILLAKKYAPRTQAVLVTGMGLRAVQPMLDATGIQAVFQKPLNLMTFSRALQAHLQLGLSGKFKGLSLSDLLQMLLLDKVPRCVTIKDKRQQHEVTLVLQGGEVRHAVLNDLRTQQTLLTGVNAFEAALQIKNGLFSENPFPEHFEHTIKQPFQSLLLSAAQHQDEAQALLSNSVHQPDAPVKRVMVIDDDILIRVLMKTHLRFQGFDVVEMDSAEAAQAFLEQDRVDLIITDVSMPQMSGLDFIRWLEQQPFHCPVMLMTAFPSEEIQRFSHAHQVWRYLKKPIQLEQLSGFLLELAAPGCEGYLTQLNTFDFVQLCLSSGERRLMQINDEVHQQTALLWVQNGRFLHATYNQMQGAEAFDAIVAIGRGRFFEKEWQAPPEQSLASDSPHRLLLRATCYLDQQNHFVDTVDNMGALEEKLERLMGIKPESRPT